MYSGCIPGCEWMDKEVTRIQQLRHNTCYMVLVVANDRRRGNNAQGEQSIFLLVFCVLEPFIFLVFFPFFFFFISSSSMSSLEQVILVTMAHNKGSRDDDDDEDDDEGPQ